MRLVPRSLYGRLLASAGLFIVIALVAAGLSIGNVLERFVMRGLDARLDAQISLLVRAVRPDGSLDTALAVDAPPFDRRGSDWAWQIRAPDQVLRSESLGTAAMPDPVLQPRRERHWRERGNEPRPVDGISRSGGAVHFRILTLETPRGPVVITAAGPRAIAERPLRQALVPLTWSLLILGIVLIAAIFLQLRFGLRPLRGLQASLAAVRQGQARHVPPDQPLELRGLVDELNALIDQNEAGLENARRHVANLAHGLKTPLAALRVKLDEGGHDPDGALRELAERMDASIRHHLARARAAAPGRPERQATPLHPHVADLVDTLARIHGDRKRAVEIAVASDLAVACDPQDLDEMLGNLLDNAWRWAGTTIRISATPAGTTVAITITDDGPGLTAEARDAALVAGRRLDERGDGHGFGLSITRELAELYGGTLALGEADSGGLAVTLTLPKTTA
ncbi:HAMP domain-containing sensor histidine kinase [Sphingomonas sp. SUN039]|uniref:sensor histidine kinase n=1 Tax=Sphingomonas sp. SUN039 TaxID=2937787 RepID=UPI0021643E6B|nr:HAMP domain-containing sensor histidine kinase [Sphingomonas sp. SUN039]UVO53998.1 HAMP domain-containing histidine kinase [Sphingomonas sp. SUN039]